MQHYAKFLKLSLLSVSILIIGAAYGLSTMPMKPAAPLVTPETKPIAYVDCYELHNAYFANENNRYQGNVVEVSGVVMEFAKDANPPYIKLAYDIRCEISPSIVDQLRKIDSMDAVQVKGLCIGMDGDTVVVKDCIIEDYQDLEM